ncbi:MAG: hypothetical protein CMA79_04395, partial [Euryarchaeota archaeon]|nr:hypothetical protein [Euryarchaeota archaeon]
GAEEGRRSPEAGEGGSRSPEAGEGGDCPLRKMVQQHLLHHRLGLVLQPWYTLGVQQHECRVRLTVA